MLRLRVRHTKRGFLQPVPTCVSHRQLRAEALRYPQNWNTSAAGLGAPVSSGFGIAARWRAKTAQPIASNRVIGLASLSPVISPRRRCVAAKIGNDGIEKPWLTAKGMARQRCKLAVIDISIALEKLIYDAKWHTCDIEPFLGDVSKKGVKPAKTLPLGKVVDPKAAIKLQS